MISKELNWITAVPCSLIDSLLHQKWDNTIEKWMCNISMIGGEWEKTLLKTWFFMTKSQFSWDSQLGRLRTTSILVWAFWNFKLKVLKYSKNCSLHNTLIPWSLKNPESPNLHAFLMGCPLDSFYVFQRLEKLTKVICTAIFGVSKGQRPVQWSLLSEKRQTQYHVDTEVYVNVDHGMEFTDEIGMILHFFSYTLDKW